MIWNAANFVYVFAAFQHSIQSDIHKSLRKHLFVDYDKDYPALDAQPVQVFLTVRLSHIRSVEQRGGMVSLQLILRYNWKDSRLCWNATDYNGITNTKITKGVVWQPKLGFFSNALQFLPLREQDIDLTQFGQLFIDEAVQLDIRKTLDISQFPFDTQMLHFEIGITGYKASEARLHVVSTEFWKPRYNIEWIIVNLTCSDNIRIDIKGDVGFSNGWCTLILRRKPGYFILNFLIPACSVTFVSIISLNCVRYVHEKRSVNFQYSLTALMAISVLTLSVSGGLPKSNEVSRFHKFYFALIGLIILTTLSSIAFMKCEKNIPRRATKPVAVVLIVVEMSALLGIIVWFCF